MKRLYIVPILLCLFGSLHSQIITEQFIYGQFNQSSIEVIDASHLENGEIDNSFVKIKSLTQVSQAAAKFCFKNNFETAEFDIYLAYGNDNISFSVANGSVFINEVGSSVNVWSGGFSQDDCLVFSAIKAEQDEHPATYTVLLNDVILGQTTGVNKYPNILTAEIHPQNSVNQEGIFSLCTDNMLLLPKVNFVKEEYYMAEGESIEIALDLSVENNLDPTVDVHIELTGDDSPFFTNYTTQQVSFAPGTLGPETFTLDSNPVNGVEDGDHSFMFEITVVTGTLTQIGLKKQVIVHVIDDYHPLDLNLFPGDMMFTAFEVRTSIRQGAQIMFKTLTPISPNMDFQVLNANYLNAENQFSSNAQTDDFPIMEFTYQGETQIPALSNICIKWESSLPDFSEQADLQILVDGESLEINGSSNSGFKVEYSPQTNVNGQQILSFSLDDNNSLFITQGAWTFHGDHAKLFGRVIHGIAIGSTWQDEVNLPEDIECFEIQAETEPGLLWGFYACNDEDFEIIDLRPHIADYNNWVSGYGTNQNDLPEDICTEGCGIDDCMAFQLEYSSPGATILNFGELTHEGEIVMNYQIAWIDENNQVAFISAAGNFFDPATMYEHPMSNIPTVSTLTPMIVSSDFGDGLNCFDPIEIGALSCNTEFYALDYFGPVALDVEFEVELNPATPVLKFAWDEKEFNDIFQIFYAGALIFETTADQYAAAVEVPLNGQDNSVKIRIQNTTPGSFSEWEFQFLNCCEALECTPDVSNDVVVDITGDACLATFTIQSGFLCDDNSIYDCTHFVNDPTEEIQLDLGTTCEESVVESPSGCRNLTGTINASLLNGVYTMDFSNIDDYNYYKDLIEYPVNANYADGYYNLFGSGSLCGIPFDGITIILFVNIAQFTFNAHSLTITADYNLSSSFGDDCEDCSEEYDAIYSQILNGWQFDVRGYTSITSSGLTYFDAETQLSETYTRWYETQCGVVSANYELQASDVENILESWSLYTQDGNGNYTILVQSAGDALDCIETIIGNDQSVSRIASTETESLERIRLFPNPASDFFMMSFGSTKEQVALLEVYDVTGRKHLSQSLNISEGENTVRVESETLGSGAYVLSLKLEDEEYSAQLIILKD